MARINRSSTRLLLLAVLCAAACGCGVNLLALRGGARPAEALMAAAVAALAGPAAVLLCRAMLAAPTERLRRHLREIAEGRRSVCDLTRGLPPETLEIAEDLEAAFSAISEQSRTDELTGLANRRQFNETLGRAFHQARRYGHALSVMTMDIDLFKAINDTKGHQAGDEVIQMVADVVRDCCRQSDMPARLGGDEFAVILPETHCEDAATLAERIRKRVLERTLTIDGSQIQVSLSIGIADLNSGGMETPEDFFGLADEALYAAKRLGRNRFVHADRMEAELCDQGEDESDRVEMLRGKLAGLDTQFQSLFVRALQEIVKAMERRDPHMADHARKVQHYSSLIGRELHLADQLIKQIELASLLHDIGMLALPDSILLCDGALSEAQIERMRRHPLIGARILEGTEFLEQVIPVVRFHHERFDGAGYPDGLSGLGIPPICRIVAVADAFDAMTSPRTFRDPRPIAQALQELQDAAGEQFDPEMVQAFLAVANRLGDRLPELSLRTPVNDDAPAPQPEPRPAPEPAAAT